MATFTYVPTIPDPNNDPSVDVVTMQTNAQALNDIWDEDHIGFNDQNDSGGTHKHLTLNFHVTPSAPAGDTQAAIYTTSSADTGKSVGQFQNVNATYPLIPIRAWGIIACVGSIGPTTATGANVTGTAAKTSGTTYTVNISANALASGSVTSNVCVLITSSSLSGGWSYSLASDVLTVTSSTSGLSGTISFCIIQR